MALKLISIRWIRIGSEPFFILLSAESCLKYDAIKKTISVWLRWIKTGLEPFSVVLSAESCLKNDALDYT